MNVRQLLNLSEVHYCPVVWDVSSAASNDTKNKQKLKVVTKGGGFLLIYGFAQTLLFMLRRLRLRRPCCELACVVN